MRGGAKELAACLRAVREAHPYEEAVINVVGPLVDWQALIGDTKRRGVVDSADKP